jgi:hypothetical protein
MSAGRYRWPVAGHGRVVAVIALVAVTATAAGCGPTLRAGSLDAQIADRLSSGFGAGRPEVTCPGNVPAAPGRTFVCTASWDGHRLAVHGRVLGADGRVSVAPAGAAAALPVLAARIAADLSGRTANRATVDCGDGIVTLTAGATVACRASEDGVTRRISVGVSTGDTVTYTLDRPGPAPAP